MNPASEDIKDMLEAESGLGLVFPTNLFIGREPSTPIDAVTIFDTPGAPPQLTFNKTEVLERPSIQIRVRNNDYLVGWALANDIKTFLHGKSEETWNGTVYLLVKCVNTPFLLGTGKKGDAWFVTNFELQRR